MISAGTLLAAALAPATKTVYSKVWHKFNLFTVSIEQPCLPASVAVVSLFIGSLVSSSTPPKPSSLATSLSAISYYHKISGVPDPTSDFLIRKLLQGLSKSNPSSDHRLPITFPLLQTIISSSTQVTSSPYEASLLPAMYSLMFHAFLRIGEVTTSPHNIQLHQVSVQSHITLVFTSFKHHHGPPFTLIIPPSQSTSCPVSLLSTYLGVRGRSPGPLFSYPDQSPISPSRFRALLKMSLSYSSIQSSNITPHSFRIGAATFAASQGLSSSQIQAMGRWHSSASDKYIRISSFKTPQS